MKNIGIEVYKPVINFSKASKEERAKYFGDMAIESLTKAREFDDEREYERGEFAIDSGEMENY